MRASLVALFLFSANFLTAAEPIAPAEEFSIEGLTPREAALEHLLSERGSLTAFEAAVADARKKGVTEQALLEARFLFHVDRQEDDALAAMLPDFRKRAETFKIEESEIFGTQEDWLAVTEYIVAIDALKRGDKDAFKKHITEAFWLSPRQGAAFAPHIDRLRMKDAMRSVKIDFSTELKPVSGADPISLEKIVEGKKALLFHFWSPWSRESEATLPEFAAAAVKLDQHGIAVVSLLLEDSAKVLTDAREILKNFEPAPPGNWLIDQKQNPLSRLLRVQSVPVIAVISPEGNILFNGHFTDDELWNVLKKIDATIVRPELSLDLEQP
jgi:hypothetical protein